MRHYPSDKWDKKETKQLNPDPWMLDLLKLNPGYCSWGPHEDYMWRVGREEPGFDPEQNRDSGWEARVLVDGWAAFDWNLDDMNECANFYFEVERDSESCSVCGGSGYHPDAQWISESFYQHSTPFRAATLDEQAVQYGLRRFGIEPRVAAVGKHDGNFPEESTLLQYGPEFREFCESMRDGGFWHDKITQDEADALIEADRCGTKFRPETTAEAINAVQHGPQSGLNRHDDINRSILVDARCKRLGVPRDCELCKGHGHCFTEPKAHVNLILWILHPRKGCSRGVEIKRIEQDDLPAVFKWLRAAADRNAERFSKIP